MTLSSLSYGEFLLALCSAMEDYILDPGLKWCAGAKAKCADKKQRFLAAVAANWTRLTTDEDLWPLRQLTEEEQQVAACRIFGTKTQGEVGLRKLRTMMATIKQRVEECATNGKNNNNG